MADEQEAIVRRSIDEVWNGGRLEVIDEIVADDYVRHESMLPRVVRGRDELKATVTLYRDAFPDVNVVIEDMVSSEVLVTTRWRASGTHRGELMGLRRHAPPRRGAPRERRRSHPALPSEMPTAPGTPARVRAGESASPPRRGIASLLRIRTVTSEHLAAAKPTPLHIATDMVELTGRDVAVVAR